MVEVHVSKQELSSMQVLGYLLLIMQNAELLLMAVEHFLQHGTPACQLFMLCLYFLQLSCHVSKLLLHGCLCHLQKAQRLLLLQYAAYWQLTW